MSRKALLIIDMLNDFVAQGAPLEVSKARGNKNSIPLKACEGMIKFSS